VGKAKRVPDDYRPSLKLSLRTREHGGGVLRPGKPDSVQNAFTRRECLLLIHGYNNNVGEAASAYLGFRRKQSALFPQVDGPKFNERLADVFWPGDADWGWLDFSDRLFYPKAVGNAKACGVELNTMLQSMPLLTHIDIIAHSLGCRVTCELLQYLILDPRIKVGRVCLMAAAVPREMFEPGGRFHLMLRVLESRGVRFLVLYSSSDKVLTGAFPLGQTAAGEPSINALGRVGPSATVPGHLSGQLMGRKVSKADHGDYWGHSGKPPTDVSGRYSGAFLDTMSERRAVGSTRDDEDSRSVGDTRAVAADSRSTGSKRTLG